MKLRVEGEAIASDEKADEQSAPVPSGDDLADGGDHDTSEPAPPDPTTQSPRRDLLHSDVGAWVVSSTSHYDAEWHPRLLLDGSVAKGWSSAQGTPYPNEIVFELDGVYDLEEFVVDSTNAQEGQWPGISAKDFELHVSVISGESGFERVLAGTAEQEARSVFALDAPASARWLKLVVLSNWGHPEFTEIMELAAHGEAAAKDGGDMAGPVETDPEPAPEQDSTAPKVTFELPKGQIHALVTTDPKARPLTAMAEIPADLKQVFVPVWSESEGGVRVFVELFAADVPGIERDVSLGERSYLFIKGEGQNFKFELNGRPPAEGYSSFPPGAYRAQVSIEGGPSRALPFDVVSQHPMAETATSETVPPGINIALAALGGRIEQVTSEYDEEKWAARNLHDGLRLVLRSMSCTRCGWASKDATVPQEVVFSFHEEREAQIGAVVIDPLTFKTLERGGKSRMPTNIEVWASTESAEAGFVKLATARLLKTLDEQVITFPATAARYVKLVFLANHGGPTIQVGEIKIMETAEPAGSILKDRPNNLALPALGGAVVRYSSQYDERSGVHRLIDGATRNSGWRSRDGYLPQDFVIDFRESQTALIDRIILHADPDQDPASRPKTVAVSVSMESPLDGFEEVGFITLKQDEEAQDLPVGRKARYIRLRILENFGKNFTSLGEIEVIEGTAADYLSALSTTSRSESISGPGEQEILDLGEPVDQSEQEPNEDLAEANALQPKRFTEGRIDHPDDADYFRVDLPEGETSVLTLDLAGQPNIRTSVSLLDAEGKQLKHFDPGSARRNRTAFSWAIEGGAHYLKVAEPPVSVVLIWDTSGSMEGSTEDLERAVTSYIDNLRPGERLNLIRFSEDVEVLLPGFTDDKAQLKAAIEGKFPAESGTALYDAIAEGVALLEGVTGNRAIVVMTDGGDSASKRDVPAFWQLLAGNQIRFYTIGLGDSLRMHLKTVNSSGDRVLINVARASNGRYLFARSSEQLSGFYQKISDDLHQQSSYYIKPSIAPGLGYLGVTSTGERIVKVSAPRIELILDASGSMRERKNRVDGKLKIDVAKQVMAEIIEGLPENAEVALRVYGHRIREGRKGDCEDSELVVPFGKADKSKLLKQVQRIKALGTTPLAYSIRQAARDFGDGDGEKVIVLVTDGKEECGERPQDAVADLRNAGVNLRLNVVGFALADEAVKRDMKETAGLSGGRFFDAQDGEGLQAALEQALAAPFDVVDASGTVLASGMTGQGSVEVPEGVYEVVVQSSGQPIAIPDVRVTYNQYTKVELKKEGQEIGTEAVGPVDRQEAAWLTQETTSPDPNPATPEADEPSPPSPQTDTPREPDRELVRGVQEKLAQLGFTPGPADGAAGPRTLKALRSFQAGAGLPVDGRFSEELLGKLNQALSDSLYVSYGTEDTLIGRSFSNRARGALKTSDLIKIQTTYSFALESLGSGEVATWNNPKTGAGGQLTIGKGNKKKKSQGQKCRDFVHSIKVQGRSEGPKQALLACRANNGTWQLTN